MLPSYRYDLYHYIGCRKWSISVERNGTCIGLQRSHNLCYLKNGVNTFVDKLLVDLEVDREQCEY